jgi:hypothetical protein
MKALARPRRGAPPKGEVSARKGICAAGVDMVVERSGVSKTSLYRLFESKDALIPPSPPNRIGRFGHGGITLRSSTRMIRVLCWTRCYLGSQSGSGAPPIAAVRSSI